MADSGTCPVCEDSLTEPLTLSCLHSFCSSCLREPDQNQNQDQDQDQTRPCPVCRRRASKEEPDVDFSLKQSISFTPEQEDTATAEEDQTLTHPWVSSESTQDTQTERRDLREQVKSDLQSLTEQRDRYKTLERTYEQIQKHTDTQAQQCESHIRAVFKHLHLLLHQEETRALEELREETHRQAHTMSPELGRIREELDSMETTIQELKELLQKDTVLHYRPQRPLPTTPALAPGLLLDQTKVLGNLDFRVWRRLRREVSYSPVLLDTNTANRRLHVSEDLRGVRFGEAKHVPENPERFSYYPIALGSEGFTSGCHQWDVEVGDHPSWGIGVAKESVDRRGKINPRPEHGLLSLYHGDGRYFNSCAKTIPVQTPPVKIRVKLDCDGGGVSFYDADHMTLLCSHKHKFTEKMFPFFFVEDAGEAETKEIRICAAEGPL